MEDNFIVKPCKEKGSLEILPKGERHFNLKKMQNLLISIGYTLKIYTPFVLIVTKEIEVSLFPSGRLLIKSDDVEKVKKIGEEIYRLLD